MGSTEVDQFQEELQNLIDKFVGRLTLAETIGALELVKHDLIDEQKGL